eukprot:6748417-Alexandrium_andersonii.AAC.1
MESCLAQILNTATPDKLQPGQKSVKVVWIGPCVDSEWCENDAFRISFEELRAVSSRFEQFRAVSTGAEQLRA